MPSSPDTLRVLLARFASIAWSTVLESMVLGRGVTVIIVGNEHCDTSSKP